jgi:hypothetical protein
MGGWAGAFDRSSRGQSFFLSPFLVRDEKTNTGSMEGSAEARNLQRRKEIGRRESCTQATMREAPRQPPFFVFFDLSLPLTGRLPGPGSPPHVSRRRAMMSKG